MCTAIKLRSADEPGAGTTQRIILGELMKLPIEAYPRGIPVVELAQRLGCSDRQIRRAVYALADRGLVALVKESRPGRQGQSLMVWSATTYEGWMKLHRSGPHPSQEARPGGAADAWGQPDPIGS